MQKSLSLRAAVFRALLATTALWMSSGQAQIVENPIPGDPVAIDSGNVSGKLLPSGVRAYFGVPFAAPPTGERRWAEPQPRETWKGVYNADRFAPECIQILRPHNINHYFGEEATSEDCLYLNIWAPASLPQGEKAPVILWLYGGGLSIGSASMPNYGGEGLAQKGVVYVTAGYRVGAFGFMAHPELTATSPHRASGNYGHLDQIAALQWIQRNIEHFGGDPNRVTVMGQSAGASSAFSLQASGLAKGLFHRIVGMSGGGLRAGSDPISQSEAEQSGLELQRALKVSSLADLRNVPADRILAAQAEFQLGGTAGTVRFRPNIDAHFMPRTPREIFASGEQNDVPLLIGFTRDESGNELRTARTLDEFNTAAKKYFGDKADQFLKLYPVRSDADVSTVGATAVRDGGMATSIRSWALGQVAQGKAATYVYMYSHPHSYEPGVAIADLNPATAGAYHTSEVPFFLLTQDVYNRIRRTRAWTDYDRALANKMSDVLVAFAKTGTPSTSEVKVPRFTVRTQEFIEFGDEIDTRRFDVSRMEFFSTVNMPGAVGAGAPRTPRD
ncbi:carboxylesterase/lipase family protein [Steroidobacter agaridevorans]|uniref:carboxylesterase/lipase family protein n=1 Tax=Steroidobacter agaridevorans TaxID=2695856 RepID=UPI0013215C8A|nr:carboxylesterase family protein [Steroidobacter agaridevorans]GFE87453.1 carboxylic ester hydrolase [Steroidobacter agaridevorans]